MSLRQQLAIEPYWPTLIYVLFIGIVWPVLIPLGVLSHERQQQRRRLMAIPLALGLGIAGYFIWGLGQYSFEAHIQNHCIVYETNAYAGIYLLVPYALATCAAFFFSAERSMVFTGLVNAIAFLAAFYLYRVYLTSAWCFFAAILSGLLYMHFVTVSKVSKGYSLRA